jgi:hypothetical protein
LLPSAWGRPGPLRMHERPHARILCHALIHIHHEATYTHEDCVYNCIPPSTPHLVQLEWHQDAQGPQDPKGTVCKEEHLSPPLAGVLRQPQAGRRLGRRPLRSCAGAQNVERSGAAWSASSRGRSQPRLLCSCAKRTTCLTPPICLTRTHC